MVFEKSIVVRQSILPLQTATSTTTALPSFFCLFIISSLTLAPFLPIDCFRCLPLQSFKVTFPNHYLSFQYHPHSAFLLFLAHSLSAVKLSALSFLIPPSHTLLQNSILVFLFFVFEKPKTFLLSWNKQFLAVF